MELGPAMTTYLIGSVRVPGLYVRTCRKPTATTRQIVSYCAYTDDRAKALVFTEDERNAFALPFGGCWVRTHEDPLFETGSEADEVAP
jgi:hypothetical protein